MRKLFFLLGGSRRLALSVLCTVQYPGSTSLSWTGEDTLHTSQTDRQTQRQSVEVNVAKGKVTKSTRLQRTYVKHKKYSFVTSIPYGLVTSIYLVARRPILVHPEITLYG